MTWIKICEGRPITYSSVEVTGVNIAQAFGISPYASCVDLKIPLDIWDDFLR